MCVVVCGGKCGDMATLRSYHEELDIQRTVHRDIFL
jgi:hypothetical protein